MRRQRARHPLPGHAAAPAPPAPAAWAGDPAVLGMLMFVVGSIAQSLALVGYVSLAAAGSAVPIILAATGLGLLVSAVWAAALGQFPRRLHLWPVRGLVVELRRLVLGLNHIWFAIRPLTWPSGVALFQISGAIVLGALTLAILRLTVTLTAVIGLVVVALVLLVFGPTNADETLTKAASYATFMFAAIGIDLFVGAVGGQSYTLGPPIVR